VYPSEDNGLEGEIEIPEYDEDFEGDEGVLSVMLLEWIVRLTGFHYIYLSQ
jgi:hypothetical protein